MEQQQTSRIGRGRRRGARRTGRFDRGNRGPRAETPHKKKNPILAFFSKLFGGAKKSNGSATRNSERGPRPARAERLECQEGPRSGSAAEATPVEAREPRNTSTTAAALAEEKPEVTNEKLYIGNLSYDTSESDLYDLFSKIGAVNNVEIVRDKSGRSKGFGFVVMNSLESAKQASAQYHRTEFMGRQIVVAGSKK
jgi:RNA recognition motif-containing protein